MTRSLYFLFVLRPCYRQTADRYKHAGCLRDSRPTSLHALVMIRRTHSPKVQATICSAQWSAQGREDLYFAPWSTISVGILLTRAKSVVQPMVQSRTIGTATQSTLHNRITTLGRFYHCA